MHLGVNLRKAFLDVLKTIEFDSRGPQMSERREYHQTDTLVLEFCKLFGWHGVPEYMGVVHLGSLTILMGIVLILIKYSTTKFVPKFLWIIRWEVDIS